MRYELMNLRRYYSKINLWYYYKCSLSAPLFVEVIFPHPVYWEAQPSHAASHNSSKCIISKILFLQNLIFTYFNHNTPFSSELKVNEKTYSKICSSTDVHFSIRVNCTTQRVFPYLNNLSDFDEICGISSIICYLIF